MTTTSIAFYPYYSRKGPSPLAAGAAAVSSPPDDELLAWQDVIKKVESAGAVSEVNGEFLLDKDLLAATFPSTDHAITRHSVMQAVAAANSTPAQVPAHPSAKPAAAAAPAPSGASAADIIGDILGLGANIPSIQQNVTQIANGTKVLKKHWWGVELAFTQDAATALATLLGQNVGGVTTLLTALATIPALAVLGAVSGIASAILKGLAAWVKAAEANGNGMLLTVYAWTIPVLTSASTPVTVP